jgi:DNA-directed RNA polymerase specialized sigma24 family protein
MQAVRLGSDMSAEDRVQDACLRWVAAGSSYTTPQRLQAYLSITMRNQGVNRHKRVHRDPLDMDPLPLPLMSQGG